VGHFLNIPEYHILVKTLYKMRVESGRRSGKRVEAWQKVYAARKEWAETVELVGVDVVRELFGLLFRLNTVYRRTIYTTDTYIKLGEAAYLLTALSGWNARGLDMEIATTKKAIGLIAYGFQPPDKWSALRVKKFARAKERIQADSELLRAVDVGMKVMARLHGYRDFSMLTTGVGPEEWSGPVGPSASPLMAKAPNEELNAKPKGLRGVRAFESDEDVSAPKKKRKRLASSSDQSDD
jgi:hypothetical protein